MILKMDEEWNISSPASGCEGEARDGSERPGEAVTLGKQPIALPLSH